MTYQHNKGMDGASDPKNWTSKGIMGRILEKIREELIMEFGVPSSRQFGATSNPGTSNPNTVPKEASGPNENDALAQSILSSGGADEEKQNNVTCRQENPYLKFNMLRKIDCEFEDQ